MVSALEAVKDGMPVKCATTVYGVPCSTLTDRVSGNVEHGTKPGPSSYLSNAEETELANFLVDVAKAGYGKSRSQIKSLAENMARDKKRFETQEDI